MENLKISLINSIRQYGLNWVVSLTFGILLVFVALFLQSANSFISSGTIFMNYTFLKGFTVFSLLEVALLVVFLLFFSLFVSLMVFAVRNNLSHVRLHYYLSEKVKKFGLQIFAFYFLYSLILLVIGTGMISIGYTVMQTNIVLLILSVFFIFVPQSIVVDEYALADAVMSNFEFISRNFLSFVFAIAVSMVLLLVLGAVEFALDQVYFLGSFASIVIALLFVIPFTEILKTELYMKKFELVRYAHLR
ncbi:MAG: hypothetical protein WC602_02130 [archaeon]